MTEEYILENILIFKELDSLILAEFYMLIAGFEIKYGGFTIMDTELNYNLLYHEYYYFQNNIYDVRYNMSYIIFNIYQFIVTNYNFLTDHNENVTMFDVSEYIDFEYI